MVANGDRMPGSTVCTITRIIIGDDAFLVDCYAIPLGGFDVVHGVQSSGISTDSTRS